MYKVYVVDDEPLMINSVIDTVSWPENGFEVVGSATDPEIAVSEICDMRPELVFCDLKMPGMDGIALIKLLREKGLDCEFIMLSAFGEFEASRSFFLMDGFDYLLKPLELQESELVLERVSRRIAEKNRLSPSTAFVQTYTDAFDELIAYITAHFNKKHTLASLSKQFNISPSYICALFSKHYESTLTIFLTNLRMTAAAERIASSEGALKEIAIDCGYSDYFYFCRVFKSYYGVPPTEYRQKHLSERP
ncbi:response regulator [Ruminococcaceae bacterium OttesenSCG-928-L11]|nr:response regulator [Ruminococcaceae bacterium OttesenSCG-928-L11]